jgi:hypothetical protein
VPAYRYVDGTVTLVLHVQPGAARSEWAGRFGEGALKLRLAAPPVDGQANRACTRFLARTFSVPPSNVTILRGQTGRDKMVEIRTVDAERWTLFREIWERA